MTMADVAFKDKYFKSRQVKVFPTAFRGGPDYQFDPESQLNTEYNFINLPGLNNEKSSYIVDIKDNKLCCVIGGYYFEISNDETVVSNPDSTNITSWSIFTPGNDNSLITQDNKIKKLWIKTRDVDLKVDTSDTGAEDLDSDRQTKILDSWEDADALDMTEPEAAEGTPYYFTGIQLSEDTPNGATAYLNILVSKNGKFIIDESSKLALIRHGIGKDSIMTNAPLIDSNNAASIENAANGDYSFAHGKGTTASGEATHSEGNATKAIGANSHAEGNGTTANKESSHAEGVSTYANGLGSHTEGELTRTGASAKGAHAEGLGNGTNINAAGEYSHSEGKETHANGNWSHTEGESTTAKETSAHAEGKETTAASEGAHSEGLSTIAGNSEDLENSKYAHAEGSSTKAFGLASHAEGKGTTASGEASHTEGNETTAEGDFSHAEGYKTNAKKEYSHAEGYNTIANGNYSHTEGKDTATSGIAAHAEGLGTIAGRNNQTAVGKYNKEEDGEFIVGIGIDADNRKNAVVVNSSTTKIQNTLKVVDNTTEKFVVDPDNTTVNNNFKVQDTKLTVTDTKTAINNTDFEITATNVSLKNEDSQLKLTASRGIVSSNKLYAEDDLYLKSDVILNSPTKAQKLKYQITKEDNTIEDLPVITIEKDTSNVCSATINAKATISGATEVLNSFKVKVSNNEKLSISGTEAKITTDSINLTSTGDTTISAENAKVTATQDIELAATGIIKLTSGSKPAVFDNNGILTCPQVNSILKADLEYSKTTSKSKAILSGEFKEVTTSSTLKSTGSFDITTDYNATNACKTVFLNTNSNLAEAGKLTQIILRQRVDNTVKHSLTLLDGNGNTNIENLNIDTNLKVAGNRLSVTKDSADEVFIKVANKNASSYVFTVADSGLIYTNGGLRSGSGIEATFFNATSDKRLKENLRPVKVEKSILDLPIYKYDFINGPKDQIGCLAQDLKEVCPELVSENADGYLTIQETKLVYLLLEEVKKLKQKLEEK